MEKPCSTLCKQHGSPHLDWGAVERRGVNTALCEERKTWWWKDKAMSGWGQERRGEGEPAQHARPRTSSAPRPQLSAPAKDPTTFWLVCISPKLPTAGWISTHERFRVTSNSRRYLLFEPHRSPSLLSRAHLSAPFPPGARTAAKCAVPGAHAAQPQNQVHLIKTPHTSQTLIVSIW